MKIFKLPDLGEGLPDAVIREWYIKVGDKVDVDHPLVAMETAKALVDVPSPFAGKIEKLYGEAGDTIETGNPLIGFEGEAGESKTLKDTGTIVGTIEAGETTLQEDVNSIPVQLAKKKVIKATPAVRMLAKQLGVDLSHITPKGNMITAEEVKQIIQSLNTTSHQKYEGKLTPLSNVRRAMVQSMSQSHRDVVPVSLMDDADLHGWVGEHDITIRLIRAIEAACNEVPIMNAYFNGEAMGYQLKKSINIGIAVDTPDGLYVPVLKDIVHHNDVELRQQINRFKEQAQSRTFLPEDLRDATIMLSNFGTVAGRYTNPILLPPIVTIIGVGRVRNEVVLENGTPTTHRTLPLSVTSDHRLITGGEIARFLKVLMFHLKLAHVKV
ncbi:dihydrolipoamide acetyltransferase family protein [Coxiella endosymbiont of Amblyomma nuttalli]|uniref:dihydrolipoamide acetyltransferase family protein n=1 Tax=Coxiella endosymbiont of Amblyomma nuttalli TaxID=2749996 RepID=UPI001BAAF98B|nr:dihydrolipoamide acetyltransferase family protein [Coxiella endosymbiont of Amblyomma nuttalli]QTS84164.1 Dihydrolipoyllysine-residue acetyltransferase component of pyruvate dehydrogenase complex [Coxiella endosymbiont of Amblyomma nuttalli]